MATPHIGAEPGDFADIVLIPGDFADIVLMPGDPLRASTRAAIEEQVRQVVSDAEAEAMLRGYHARWSDEQLEVLAVESEFACALTNPETGAKWDRLIAAYERGLAAARKEF